MDTVKVIEYIKDLKKDFTAAKDAEEYAWTAYAEADGVRANAAFEIAIKRGKELDSIKEEIESIRDALSGYLL